ncbi:MAG: flagellin [Candidatus Sericytochromatia bacterium]|nr:flagellin [Candidatus Sericytochromatia bacterium]
MSIRVNTNIASLNAQRNLSNTNQMLNKTLERLSSGLRINRAADDAAGMAVSEKMRTQIRGFSQAIANAQDASNFIATAESGLDQTTQILQRIRELSIQSASDTLVNTDRKKIQTEVNELLQELDKIAETTEFNTRALLDGSLEQAAAQEAATFEIKSNARLGEAGAIGDFLAINAGNGIVATNEDIVQDAAFAFTVLMKNGDGNAFTAAGSGVGTVTNLAATTGEFVLEVRSSLNDSVAYVDLGDGTGGATTLNLNTLFAGTLTNAAAGAETLSVTFKPDGATVPLTSSDVGKTTLIQLTGARQAVAEDKALTFHVGANEGQFLKMGVQDMRAQALRVEGLDLVGDTDAESRLRSQNAIGVVDQALEYVGNVRSRLGAMQNRVEYRIANMQVSRENLMASESRIRDADIAAETANLTKAQILVQAGTAVLTQANISPQSVLNLL